MRSLTKVSTEGAEPVTAAELRAHVRAGSDQDTLLGTLIPRARMQAEQLCRRAIVDQTMRLTLDYFPACIELPWGASEVDSVTYVDTDGNTQTLSSSIYRFDADSGRLTPSYGNVWPDIQPVTGAVKVTYGAGWADDEVPEDIIAAIMMLAGDLFSFTEETHETNLAPSGRVLDCLSPYMLDPLGLSLTGEG